MSREARRKSGTGVYHVMLRAVNRQKIFYDGNDYKKFLYFLGHYKEECGFKLYAYCLMPNHIHILIGESEVPLSTIFRKIGAGFVYWYNTKYDRVGHLFQDRFRSEAVEDESYLLTVTRYIHLNPVKAGICPEPGEYRYSSYNDYLENRGITDTDLVIGMMGDREFSEFHSLPADDCCLDVEETVCTKLTDEQVNDFIRDRFGITEPQKIQAIAKTGRIGIIKELREKGASIRQINRITGLGISEIRHS